MIGNADECFGFCLFERGYLGPVIVGTELPIPTGAGIEAEVVRTYFAYSFQNGRNGISLCVVGATFDK